MAAQPPGTRTEGPSADLAAASRSRRTAMVAAARHLAAALAARGAERVVLFGSLAQPSAWIGPNADVDLAVVMPGQNAVRFHRRLADIDEIQGFVYPLDLLVYTPAEWEGLCAEHGFLRREILDRGLILHE